MLKLALLVVLTIAASTPARAEVTDIGTTTLEQLLANGVAVIDIRRPDEWIQTGVIEGSHLQTFFDEEGLFDVRAWMAAIGPIAAAHEPIVLICRSGGRSAAVSRLLSEQLGYQQVYNAHQGILQWIAEGRPTVPHR